MNLNLLKPNKENLKSCVVAGSLLVLIALIDLLSNTFLSKNFTYFLSEKVSFFTPLIFGIFGLHLIRIEFSGNKLLDKINTNFNSSTFNATLSLLLAFALT